MPLEKIIIIKKKFQKKSITMMTLLLECKQIKGRKRVALNNPRLTLKQNKKRRIKKQHY